MKKDFPSYATHELAKDSCFNCGCTMRDQPHSPSGFPSGKHIVKCKYCGFSNYYDVRGKRANSDDQV